MFLTRYPLPEGGQNKLSDIEAQITGTGLDPAMQTYLDYCHKLPFYGAAFFRGQIIPTKKGIQIRQIKDTPVYVAINTEGISVIDMDKVKCLISPRYENLSWDYFEPQNKDNPDNMPCILLQFAASGSDQTHTLQVFSAQGTLMDKMIEVCVKAKKREMASKPRGTGMDVPDGAAGVDDGGWNDLDGLHLETFNKEGERLSIP